MRKVISGMMFVMLLTGMLVLAFNVRQAESKPGTIIVPNDYPTIHDAIGNASAGDTIFVRAGTYHEHIDIDKPLTLAGESNRNTTIELLGVDGLIIGIHIVASDVTIKGFNLVYPNGQPIMLIVLDGRTANCTNNTIENNVLADRGSHTDALGIIGASHNRIMNNTIEHNRNPYEGSCIFMFSSDYNVVSYNTLVGGWVGIELDFCNNNVILGNDICNQTIFIDQGAAIELEQSSNNVIVGNTLTANEVGVNLNGGNSNLLYHNNFAGNLRQVFVNIGATSNVWDNGYPDGGNYWDDYNGTDSYSGAHQNVTGGDGIGDNPYVISNAPFEVLWNGATLSYGTPSVNNTDRYPLMNPVKKIVGDVNMDGRVDGKDIALAAWSFGSVPGDLRWNSLADLNGDGKIDGRDIIQVARHFGEHYL